MEFIKFRIRSIQKSSFEQAFHDICRESVIDCKQWEFVYGDDFITSEIPKYAVDKMTPEQIDLLNSFA